MPPRPLVTVVDDALPAPVFAALQRAVVGLKDERLRATWRTAFWFQRDSLPATAVEEAALALVQHVPARVQRRFAGVEWWLSRMRTSNVGVDFHRDRDNHRFDETGEERNPLLSSVLYLNRCKGGLLAVTRQPPNPKNPALAPDKHDFDFVEPAPNRYGFFDGRFTHGVLDARNHLPGARLPREPELRLAVAINFWDRRPVKIPTFGESPHYRRLSRARAG